MAECGGAEVNRAGRLTGIIRSKAGARPVQGRCKAGQRAALVRDCTGFAPGLVRPTG